jgi:hypothetical protein
MSSIRRVLLSLVAVVGAAAFAGLASSATPKPATVQDVHVVGAKVANPLHVVVSGQITCTLRARFAVYGWVLDQADGALARGKTPPKVRPNSPAAARFKAATTCTGSPQPWSLVATSAGKKPLPFVKGPGEACLTVYLRKSHRYTDLKQSCEPVSIT